MSSDGYNNFSSVIASLAAIAAVYIGWMGLNTWKSQIKWQNDHDLARRLLVEIYRFRDAVADARNPFIWAHEMREEGKETTSGPRIADEHHAGRTRAHQRRFNEIGVSGPQIYALLLEAEAVWGQDMSKLWKVVNRLKNELMSETERYLESSHPSNKEADETAYYGTKEAKLAARLVVFSNSGTDGKNEFFDRFASAIASVEDYLRTKLGRATT